MTLAAGRLGLFDDVHAQSRSTTQAGAPGTHTSFASLKQIDAGALNVGYAEAGPANGPVVMLLHGWPYDIHTYVDVAPLLAAKGYRVIVPHVRGYGSTSFLSTSTARNGQPSVIALDVMALMDAFEHRQGHRRGLRLGRSDRCHRRGAMAGAVQGPGLGERLPDRQP